MNTTTIDPISQQWTTKSNSLQLAYAVVDRLAHRRVADIPRDMVPFLAASAAELTEELGLQWRISSDETTVILIRIITRAALADPSAGGLHTVALLDRLLAV